MKLWNCEELLKETNMPRPVKCFVISTTEAEVAQ